MNPLFYVGAAMMIGTMAFSIISVINEWIIDIPIIGIALAVGWVALAAGSIPSHGE